MRSPRGEQLAALFEALKGLLVLLVGFGLLSAVNEDLAQPAEKLIGHLHVNPASRYPRIFVEVALRLSDLRLWLLALFAFADASLRWAEPTGCGGDGAGPNGWRWQAGPSMCQSRSTNSSPVSPGSRPPR
jgi:hypothetical protein